VWTRSGMTVTDISDSEMGTLQNGSIINYHLGDLRRQIMYKRKSKPDLMFLLTVFVCLGVLVTATVSASEAEQQGWAMTVSSETNCPQTISAWQRCAGWQAVTPSQESGIQRAAISFSHEKRADLGIVWYYSQDFSRNDNNISNIQKFDFSTVAGSDRRSNGQFGLAVRQQYRHFGFSVGLESEQVLPLNNDVTLFLGVSNRW